MSKKSYNIRYRAIVKETEKAYFVKFGDLPERWIPKSQCKIKPGNIMQLTEFILKKIDLNGNVLYFCIDPLKITREFKGDK